MPEAPLRNLTPEEIIAFWTDGAVCARQVMPSAWIDRMATAVEQILVSPGPAGQQWKRDRGFAHDLYMYTFHKDFRDFVFESPAVLLINQILKATTVRFFYDQLFVKEPGSTVRTEWHHDITFWPVAGEQVCSMWLPLDPVDRASSGLEYIRDSHRWPNRFQAIAINFDGEPFEIFPRAELEEVPNINADRDQYDIISWDFELGDVLLFHPATVHGSGANISQTRRRRAFASRWVGDDVVFTNSPAEWLFPGTHELKLNAPVDGPMFPVVWQEEREA